MKLADVVKAIGLVAQVLPALVAMIREVEGHADGPEKRQAVLAFLDVMLGGIGTVVTDLTAPMQAALRAVAGAAIDGVVAVFNLLGIFRKAPAAPPPLVQ